MQPCDNRDYLVKLKCCPIVTFTVIVAVKQCLFSVYGPSSSQESLWDNSSSTLEGAEHNMFMFAKQACH